MAVDHAQSPSASCPQAVATLAAGRQAGPDAVAAEQARIERLILHGGRRRWLAYLHEVVDLIAAGDGADDPDVAAARAVAIKVIANHHNLLLGLPDYDPTHPGLIANDSSRLRALDHQERLGAS